MKWHDVELVWVEYLKSQKPAIYLKYRQLAEEYAVFVWGENYRNWEK